MAQSCVSHCSDSSLSSIKHWLGQIPCHTSTSVSTWRKRSAPGSQQQQTRSGSSRSELTHKRKRTMALSRSQSPRKRSRADAGEPPPEQSASVSSVTELTARTLLPYSTRSNPSTSSRPTSPVRDIFNELRMSIPPILYEPPGGTQMPDAAVALRKSLTEGFGERVIPIGLKSYLQALYPEIMDDVPDRAFNLTDERDEKDLDKLLKSLEAILRRARECDIYGQDENAWCMEVIQPLMSCGLALSETNILRLKSVQSQTIDPNLLPRMQNSTRVNKKADYAFCFACDNDEILSLYNKVSLGGAGFTISQTSDAFTKRIALFSGIEVKQDDGGKKEALAQLCIWLAAGLCKVQKLGELGHQDQYSSDEVPPTIGFTIVGHEWYTYLSYKSSDDGQDPIHVIGPLRPLSADTRDIYGLFKILDLVKRVVAYAAETYWPWLRDEILTPLAE